MKEKGYLGEAYTCDHLIKLGFTIKEKNYLCPLGEIDIIAQKKDYIHFIEVKYYAPNAYYHPAFSITAQKKKRISKTAKWYIQNHPKDCYYQFDLAIVKSKSEVEILENIFNV